jgi:hypothetical protein
MARPIWKKTIIALGLLVILLVGTKSFLGPYGPVIKLSKFVDVAYGPDISIVDMIRRGNNYSEVKAKLDAESHLVTHFYHNGLSLLHYAVMWDRKDLIPMLIEKGANVNESTKGRPSNIDPKALYETPIYYTYGGDISVMQMLLKYGADPNIKCRHYKSYLEALEHNHQYDLANVLRKAIEEKESKRGRN